MRLGLSEEKTILLAPFLLVLLVFFIPISSSMKSILLGLTTVALLFTPYYKRHLAYAYGTFYGRAALGLFAYIIIASLWSKAPFSMQLSVIDKYSKLIYLPILAVGFIDPRTRRWALNSYLAVMLLTCILSLLKAKNLITLNTDDPGEVFYNHIATGFMVALGVYIAGYMALDGNFHARWQKYFYWFMVLLGSFQLFFVNTGRTGYVTYAVLMPLLILQKLSLRKAALGILLLIGAMGMAYVLSPVMQLRTQQLLSDIQFMKHHEENTSLGFRMQFHDYAKSLFEEHPVIGIGTGGFKYRFSKEQPIPAWGAELNDPHSQYWLTLAEQGIIGILLWFLFLGSLFINIQKTKETKPLLLGILVVFCIGSLSDTIFCYSTAGSLLIVISAICLGELIESKEKEYIVEKNRQGKMNTTLHSLVR